MSEPFDPYHKWLAIPAAEQPPHHYRLLGLPVFEVDQEVIAGAAVQRMNWVRKFQTGENAKLANKLAREIKDTWACLLNVEQKQKYDAEIKEKNELLSLANEPSRDVLPPMAADSFPNLDSGVLNAPPIVDRLPPSVSTQSVSNPFPTFESDVIEFSGPPISKHLAPAVRPSIPFPNLDSGVADFGTALRVPDSIPAASVDQPPSRSDFHVAVPRTGDRRNRKKRRSFGEQVIKQVLGGAVGLILGYLILCQFGSQYDFLGVFSKADAPKKQDNVAMSDIPSTKPEGKTPLRNEHPSPQSTEQRQTLPPPSHTEPLKPQLPTTPSVPQVPDLKVDLEQHQALDDEQPIQIAPPNAPATNAVPQNLTVPNQAAQTAASKLIDEVYKSSFETSKSPAQKTALAQKLLSDGISTTDDPVGRYVLLQMAQENAVKAGNWEIAFDAIDRIADTYQVDAVNLKTKSLVTIGANLQKPSEFMSLLFGTNIVLVEVIETKRFDLAEQLANLAVPAVKKSRPFLPAQGSDPRIAEINGTISSYSEAASAFAVLKQHSDDPSSNTAAGKFMCFVMRNWDLGLPMLLAGIDEQLKELATRDISSPVTTLEQVALADKWWELSENEKGLKQNSIRRRAAFWYLQGSTDTTGLTKAKIDKRLESVPPDDAADFILPYKQQTKLPSTAARSPGNVHSPGNTQPLLIPVNLLGFIEPTRDALAGTWATKDGKLLTSGAPNTLLEIPFDDIPSEYELEMQVQRIRGAHVIGIGLVLDAGRVNINIDFQGRISGIDFIDGVHLKNRPTQRFEGALLQPGRVSKVHCVVHPDAITVDVDGQKVVDWQGDSKRLLGGVDKSWPNHHRFFIWSDATVDAISRLQLQPLK